MSDKSLVPATGENALDAAEFLKMLCTGIRKFGTKVQDDYDMPISITLVEDSWLMVVWPDERYTSINLPTA